MQILYNPPGCIVTPPSRGNLSLHPSTNSRVIIPPRLLSQSPASPVNYLEISKCYSPAPGMHAALSPTRNRSRIFHPPRTHRLFLQKHTITLPSPASPLRTIEQNALHILCRHAHAFRLLVGSIDLPHLEGVPVHPMEGGRGEGFWAKAKQNCRVKSIVVRRRRLPWMGDNVVSVRQWSRLKSHTLEMLLDGGTQ